MSNEERVNDEEIINAKVSLRNHISNERNQQLVFFYVERAPYSSSGGAACRLPTCNAKIKCNDYRMAVYPGMGSHWAKSADLYHVECFEKLVDFSQANYLDRIEPVTRNNFDLRGLRYPNAVDSFVNGGAERLVLEWKVSMGRLMDERDGVPHKPMDPAFESLLKFKKSNAKEYTTPKRLPNMPLSEYLNLTGTLAPIEIDETGEWNLFEEYLLEFDKPEDLQDPHSLSDTLELWKFDCRVVHADEEELNDFMKKRKEELDEKAIRAIKRLSASIGVCLME